MGGEKQLCREDLAMENGDDNSCDNDNSANSNETFSSSSSSSELLVLEDGASTTASSFGPLYELSDLMAHLPIKRGLSKYYNGKSESYGCLGSVKSLEDLAKKGNSLRKRMKSCKRFGPKATINKKSSRKLPIAKHSNKLFSF